MPDVNGQWPDSDHEEGLLRGVSVAILTVIEDDDAAISPNVRDVAVVWEGTIALHDLPDLSTAFAYLFGLLYALNMDYPKETRYTFEAIQTIFYELGSRCSQRIRSRKTKLLLRMLTGKPDMTLTYVSPVLVHCG
ncbi:hypothetical protein KUCAC02_011490 [Chaenocephalus aceratus]|uniref:Uncharacterized protein n=1 Tax=Chaenocephalus aceratus TaxID=36190 RepID=A0ACB9WXR8_CHAAC|nr:hypothetical protein KUCAC02_011490 [Chaenocephalus aceratus]